MYYMEYVSGNWAEKKIVAVNKVLLLSYWRKILRICKTEEFKNEIDIYI